MRYTFIKQHDATDCAAACMGMVCLHYRKETTITKLRDLMGTDLKGTNIIGLSKCAKQLGYNWLRMTGKDSLADIHFRRLQMLLLKRECRILLLFSG